MKDIHKQVRINIPPQEAFQRFAGELNSWWPKAYTWSQDKLQEICIGEKKGGLCSETGPNGFRCDWGSVLAYIPGEKIVLRWQIGPKREPVPDPEKASEITILFEPKDEGTILRFTHAAFERHGEGAAQYRESMDSEQGWDYILDLYKQYCEQDLADDS